MRSFLRYNLPTLTLIFSLAWAGEARFSAAAAKAFVDCVISHSVPPREKYFLGPPHKISSLELHVVMYQEPGKLVCFVHISFDWYRFAYQVP